MSQHPRPTPPPGSFFVVPRRPSKKASLASSVASAFFPTLSHTHSHRSVSLSHTFSHTYTHFHTLTRTHARTLSLPSLSSVSIVPATNTIDDWTTNNKTKKTEINKTN